MTTNYYELLLQEDINVGIGTATKRSPAGGSLVGTQVGIHSWARGKKKVTATWDPPVVANAGQVTTTVTVSGAVLGDFAKVAFSLDLQGLRLDAYVSATNVVTVVLSNLTGAAVDLASGTLSVLVFQSR